MRRCTTCLLGLLALLLGVAPAAHGTTYPAGWSDWQVSVLTFGPGPLIFERYGHVAIRFRNPVRGTDVCFDWGNFSFDDPNFFGRFARGDLRYWMEGKPTARMLEVYIDSWDRTVVEQTLNLTSEQNVRLRGVISDLDDDVHRFYAYDYFRDNCATRVRDALDAATDGALRRAVVGPTPHSYRWQDRRLVPVGAVNVAIGVLMDFAGGPRIDPPLSRWDACFLPTTLSRELDEIRIVDAEGNARPLVSERRVLNATRSPGNAEPAAASDPIWWTLPLGVGGAGVLLALARRLPIGFKLLASAWEAFALVGSLMMLAMIAFTTHWPVVWNQNLLQFTPLAVIVLVAIWWTSRRPRLLPVAALAVGLSAAGALLTLSHLAIQRNAPAIALGLPLHAAVLVGLRRLGTGPNQPSRGPT